MLFWREKMNLYEGKGSRASLFPVKHCWMRKTNMATVSRLQRGFSFNTFPSLTFSMMGSNNRLYYGKIAIFKLFGNILLSRHVSFYGRFA